MLFKDVGIKQKGKGLEMSFTLKKIKRCIRSIALVVSFLCLFILYIHNNLLKKDVAGLAVLAGSSEAINDYKKGKIRFFQPKKGTQLEFSGAYNGEFEVWYWPYYESFFYSQERMAKVFTDAYNSKMVRLIESEKENDSSGYQEK